MDSTLTWQQRLPRRKSTPPERVKRAWQTSTNTITNCLLSWLTQQERLLRNLASTRTTSSLIQLSLEREIQTLGSSSTTQSNSHEYVKKVRKNPILVFYLTSRVYLFETPRYSILKDATGLRLQTRSEDESLLSEEQE